MKLGHHSINRAEAIAVFRELSQLHREIVAYAELVEISKQDKANDFQIKIKCVLDAHGRKIVDEFLKEKKLKMREEKGFVLIYQ